ncbi:hypothetical protein FACS1894139_11960 [Planctomycetales bacterium]|nr:hypothetical protein FACS1894107_08980 [Planctomycetales bacterium]GHT06347.1 hypothetical protein FACS1894139_11960 [Planctomycetales bacterium]
MPSPKIYLETTMFNYYFDRERRAHSTVVAVFDAMERGEFEPYTSDYVTDELVLAPEPKRSRMMELIAQYGIRIISANEEIARLSERYRENGAVPPKKKLDATHIAAATIAGVDYILSLNFRHINKAKTKRLTEMVNLNAGYRGVVICSPKEALENGKQKYD